MIARGWRRGGAAIHWALAADPHRRHRQPRHALARGASDQCVSSSGLAPVAVINFGPVEAATCNALLVDEVLIRAFAPVLRDLEGAGVSAPGIRDNEWSTDPEWLAVSLIDPRGGDQPVRVERSLPEPLMVAELADAVQEWAITELWPNVATNWPVCPHHPATHPLQASTVEHVAVWMCPTDGSPIVPVGSL